MSNLKPRQMIPASQKTEQWGKNSLDYFLDACIPIVDPKEAKKLYQLANGDIDPNDYSYVTNPLNTTRKELQGYGGRLKNFDIISPNVMSLLGDKKNRNLSPVVLAKNSEYETLKAKELKKEMAKELQKKFINESIALGIQLEEEQITEEFSEIQKKVKNIPNMLAKEGHDTLDCVLFETDARRHFRKAFYDFVVTATITSYKDIIKDKVYYEIMSPLHAYALISDQYDFYEDGEAFKAVHYMSINDIIGRFQNEKGFDKIAAELEDRVANYGGGNDVPTQRHTRGSDIDTAISMQHELFSKLGIEAHDGNPDAIKVEHVVWRGFTRVGKVPVFDFKGNVEYIEVDEDFTPKDGVEWDYVDQIYEGYKIDDKYYVAIQPIPFLRGENAKLPYNGRSFHTRHTRPQSLVKKGEAYQKTVNTIRYTMERTLAKNMDKLMIFPMGLIPNKEGWDEKTVMYYAQALSFLFVDETKANFANAIQALKGVDMSLGKYVIEAQNLIQMTKQEWDDVSGMSPQRKAQIAPSAGKGTTEAAIDRSFVISEELFSEVEEFEEREYNGFLHLSKFAYSEGKKAYFGRPDGTTAFLNITDPVAFANADFKVFIKNSTKELKKLEELRANAQAFAQNQAKPSMVAQIIGNENYHELVEYMEEMEADLEARQRQAQESAQASAEKIAAQESRDKQDELDFKYYKVDADNANDIETALIRDTQTLVTQELEAGETNPDNNDGFDPDRMAKVQDNLIKVMEIRSKERMNKDNNKTALKNKVSGEK